MPPFPVFTFIGFAIHAAVFYAVAFRFLVRKKSRMFFFMGMASLLDAINFSIILLFFFFFPNSLFKSEVFLFNATVIVPLAVLFFVASLVYYWPASRKFVWLFIGAGCIFIAYHFYSVHIAFRLSVFEASYIHPAYPKMVASGQFTGIISSFLFAVFFFYNAFFSSMFVKRRALILGMATFLLGISTVYWIASTPSTYIFTHTVGPIGSLLVALGIFWYAVPEEVEKE